MGDAEYYRTEARRFLDWAEMAADGDTARRWRRLAEDYATLAEELGARTGNRPPILAKPVRQRIQQQQGKLGNDETPEC